MAKWQFSYTLLDGRRGQFKVSASSKTEAISKGIDRTKNHGSCETIIRWDCRLVQA